VFDDDSDSKLASLTELIFAKRIKSIGDTPAGEPTRTVIRRPICGHLRHLR
jgi:hypothetical protein